MHSLDNTNFDENYEVGEGAEGHSRNMITSFVSQNEDIRIALIDRIEKHCTKDEIKLIRKYIS